MMTRATRFAVVGVLAFLAACAGDGARDKPGGPQRPIELTLTNHDSGDGLPSARGIARFVESVRRLSAGRIEIRVKLGDWATDGREVEEVAVGDADLGWVGTRALDLLGVDEFRALHAPMLIDSYPLQAAVLAGGASQRTLRSLERLDVEPLAILADELRFPATARNPLVDVADWQGAKIWLLESDSYADAVEAFGATVLHGGDIRQMLQDGSADGNESTWIYYSRSASYLYTPFVTPNVVLSPRTLVLFANSKTMGGLAQRERKWLRDAASDAARWSREHAGDHVQRSIENACRYGARIALASGEQLGALRAKVEPLYARLRASATTAATMTHIEAAKARTPAPAALTVPAGCAYMPGETLLPSQAAPLSGPGPIGDFPTGTYRYMITPEEVVHAGDVDSILHESRAGVFTWRMGRGEWSVTATPSRAGVEPVTCDGWYAVDRHIVTFTYRNVAPRTAEEYCLPGTWAVRWAPVEGTVRWGPPSIAVLAPHFTLATWERIS